MRQPQFEKDSFRHVIKRQPARLLALTSLGLVFAALFASAATPQSTGTYTASISPASATASNNQSFTIVITNTSAGTEPLGSVNVTAPSLGVNSIGAVTAVTEPAGKTWTATVFGSPSDTIKLRAADLASTLAPGEQITASGSARFCTAGSSTWTTAAKESIDFSGAEDLTISGSEPPLTVNAGAGPISTFSLSTSPTTVAAGDASNLTITAKDTCGNTADSYVGTHNLTFGGASASPNSTQPTVSDNAGTPQNFGTSTSIDFASGVATVSGANNGVMKLYKVESPNITVTDGTYSTGSPLAMTVNPGPLDHFAVSNPGTQTAGTSFNVTVGAEDLYGNAASGWTSTNGCVIFSGPFNSPPPSETPPTYPAPGACFGTHPDSSELTFDASGQATANITLRRATTALTVPSATDLTVKDALTQTKQGATGSFAVNPGDLFDFRWTNQPDATQTAGVAFDSVAATAYDQWDNIKTDYNSAGAVFSGLGNSPDGDSPTLPFTWTNGVASSSGVIDKKAETTKLKVADGTIFEESDPFTVKPNKPDTVEFVQQPTLTQFNTPISPAVTVLVKDDFGNPVPHDPLGGNPVAVTMELGSNPSSGTLSGGTPAQNTNGSGIATFSALLINNPGVGYTLVARVPSTYPPGTDRTATSVAIEIANQVTQCTGTCTAQGSTPNSTTTLVDAFGLTSPPSALNSRLGPAVSTAPTSARLGVTVAGSVPIPTNPAICAGPGVQAGLGDGFWITTFQSSSDLASFRVVATLNKNEVREKPGNPGATKFDICLGAKNTKPGTLLSGCNSPTDSVSWKEKDGTCAEFDAATGLYWGLVANYPSKVKSCPTTPGSNLFPGVLSKMKTGAGDVVITFCKPYPWDGGGAWR